MEYNYIEKRYNVMGLASIDAFAGIKGGMNGNCKDVYFLRATGADRNFLRDVACMDEAQTDRMLRGQGIYNRVGAFPRNLETDMAARYMGCYQSWLDTGRERLFTIRLGRDSGVGELLGASCKKVVEAYRSCNPNMNGSIEKNFVVKLLYWLDELAYGYLKEWNPRQSMKFVAQGVTKEQEYFFCYFLTLLGIDVLLLQNEADIDDRMEALHLSEKIALGEKKAVALDAYDSRKYASGDSIKDLSKRESSRVVPQEGCQVRMEAGTRYPRVVIPRELGYEELALLASSVVMIAVHDGRGDIIGSGSGIMIGRAGYILTNNHVARGGSFYSVRIENDDHVYRTDEIIKYNPVLDLAVIRIDRALQPLPVYQGGRPLARGQRVVAIGSPLGLFNSVSDGIISGFRRMDDVDMIQFTAPISHGSSGGAVLDLYGRVIGVSTAGIDEGQNINLAVGYEFINSFIKGFQ